MAFNAHHSPIGAYATLTLGAPGRSGLGVESGMPLEHELLAGVQAPDGTYEALPFFVAEAGDPLRELAPVTRDFGVVADTWAAPGVSLRVVSPLRPVPEPDAATPTDLRDALVPAVLAELTIDNLASDAPRRAFFGVRAASDSNASSPRRLTHAYARDYGFVLHDGNGRMAGAFSIAPEASAAAGTEVAEVLGGPPGGSGNIAALRFDVPAHEQVSYLLVVVFWHGGTVTFGADRDCTYWYTRLFADIEDAAAHALEHFNRLDAEHRAAAAELDAAALSEPQRFQLAHAVRSYYGNTALLATPQGRPLWAVMEGELRSITRLDLTVDQLFFELRQSPWTVRSALDAFLERHSRRDESGLAFAQHMGAFPCFSAPGTSAHEKGVWTTGEAVADWTLAALVYVEQTGDEAWARAHLGALEQCLESLLVRAPNGLPVGAGKHWAAHVCLAAFLAARGREEPAARAEAQARLVADRLVDAAEGSGHLPALVSADGHTGTRAQVTPLVEGLVYPLFAGAADALDPDGRYGAYVRMLRAVTSAHDDTWLSEAFLAQFVARRILGLPARLCADPPGGAWCDPRRITAALWLEEDPRTARLSASREGATPSLARLRRP